MDLDHENRVPLDSGLDSWTELVDWTMGLDYASIYGTGLMHSATLTSENHCLC